jgi:hypothetical protein
MNIKKGLFRLTLVLSIAIGIISAFVMIERESYTRYKVKRTGGGLKELTVTFHADVETQFDNADFAEIFHEVEELKSKNTGEIIDLEEKQGRINDWKEVPIEEWEKATPIDKIDREKLPTYTILKKTVKPIKWNNFFYKMAIGFTSGFTSIWVIYAFIRWVIVFFVIGGFKSKATQ